MSDLYLVWRNLTRKRLRFALTLFSILVAFLIHGVLSAFGESLSAGDNPGADERLVTVNRINFTQPLPIAYLQKIRALEGVRLVTHQAWFGGYVREPRNLVTTFAVDPETFLDTYGGPLGLGAAEIAAFRASRQAALVGKNLAQKQGWKLGDRIPLQSNIYQRGDGSSVWEVEIAGIFPGTEAMSDANRVLIHYDYLDEGRTFGTDQTGMIIVTPADPRHNERIARAIDALFANSAWETQTDTAKAFNKAFVAQLGNIALIITSVVSAAFFTILLIVGNTTMLAIRERTTEIAVLKTLGFRATRIFRLVLAESMFLSLLGGLAGLGLAALVVAVLRQPLSGMVGELALGSGIVLRALGIMLALGLVTGLLPAWGAMRLNIVQALGRN
jgi:putative ABC transport system permease protein